ERTTVWFAWPDAHPGEEQRHALDSMLARVARIGHSSTLVACRSANSAPPTTWAANDEALGQRRLRGPRPGLLGHLERACAAHQGHEPRTLPAGMTGYRRFGDPEVPRPASPLLSGNWYVLGIHGRPPSAVHALVIARAARDALTKHSVQP